MNFEDIPSYYLYKGSPMDLMLYNDSMINISKEDFMNRYKETIRNNEPIKDENDFQFTLFCLSEWMVNDLPQIVLDYIDANINKDYSQYKECDLPILYYDLIIKRINSKLGFKRIIYGAYQSIGIKEDGNISMWNSCRGKDNEIYSQTWVISVPSSIGIKQNGQFMLRVGDIKDYGYEFFIFENKITRINIIKNPFI